MITKRPQDSGQDPPDSLRHRDMVKIGQKANEQLAAWPGYKPFNEAVRNHPDVSFFLAGGTIRDIVLKRKRPPKDFDFFLGGDRYPSVIAALKKRGKMILGPFGSPRWFPENREECHADIIPIDGFYNGLWYCKDIRDVLNQFDFTGNAIAVDLRTGHVHDPQNGIRDLSFRIMKMVRFDYPDEPIQSGHPLHRLAVLWFRVLHYAAVLGLVIEPVTLRWLRANRAYERFFTQFSQNFFTPCATYRKSLQDLETGCRIAENG